MAIDYVQGDPFASPSKIRLIIPSQQRPLHASWLEPKIRKVAVEDVLARAVAKAVRNLQIDIKGSGKSGAIFFDAPKQQVIERTAVQISPDAITVCLSVGLPANGRRINGRQAQRLFSEAIPAILQQSIFAISDEEINQAVVLADQQAAIRDTMKENSWIGFVANGAILPRKSGVNDLPLKDAIHFQSPKSFETEISIPHQCEPLKGMAIPKGVTLIVGGDITVKAHCSMHLKWVSTIM
ncbi:ABC-ATPase domain-containing protein [Virgibacillus sp. 179-BFC.A HS]|uniref:ABC-ATPase domain-containing protein n=1 Tax=Tigheibacillus jepli TaxID=3035914 RepID=A0ABU5CLH2_9BACI|nr:ABC-ATPase domain-containing protein [Virgibacillus sp. 179-BFC.A HS]MDY0406343.1 ABC-ATPase domain-containing protein [Virgibacillus sp. 179-BFC.A HS]